LPIQDFLSQLAYACELLKPSQHTEDMLEFSPAAIRALYPIMRYRDGASVGVKLLLHSSVYLLPGDVPDHLAGLFSPKEGGA
jgi:hypothetical protein